MVELAEKLIRSWDKPKGEVVIDVEIMEVSRVKLRQLGMDFGDAIVGLRYGGSTPAPARTPRAGSTSRAWPLGQAGNYSVTLPSAYLQILESDSDTKIIAQPRLRGVSDEKITYKVGQKVPIPQTTFMPFAAGGYSSNPLTSFQQQDVGIEINFTPRVHQEKDVTLDAEIKVTSIGGTGYADIPIINNREIKNVVRLKDGETQLIAGLIRDEERKVDQGHPRTQGHPRAGPPVRAGDDQHRADRRHRHHHALRHPDHPEDRRGRQAHLGRRRHGLGGGPDRRLRREPVRTRPEPEPPSRPPSGGGRPRTRPTSSP